MGPGGVGAEDAGTITNGKAWEEGEGTDTAVCEGGLGAECWW